MTQRPASSCLVVETGDRKGLIFALRDTVVSIGRGPENTLQIIDPRMSRSHSLLIRNGDAWFVRDLGSKNGTLVNDRPVEGDALLCDGDRLQIGDTLFIFKSDRAASTDANRTTGVRMLDDDGSIRPSHALKVRADGVPWAVPADDRGRLEALDRVAELIGTEFDLDALLQRVLDVVEAYLKPDRAAVLLYDEQFRVLVPKVSRRPNDEELIISTSIVERAIGQHEALLVGDAPHDFRFRSSDSVILQRIQSAICVPLLFQGRVLGVLYVDRRTTQANYTPSDLKLAAGIANQAAVAVAGEQLHRRLLARHGEEREIEIARSIQEKLLPSAIPQLPGFEIFGLSQPARMVGGDYFDVIALPDGRCVLVVGDVSGKGIPAAILLAGVRAAVQVEVRALDRESLPTILERLNQMVERDTASNMFVTMVLSVLDPARRTFTYCNAGHVHPMLGHPDGRIQLLESGGCFLGLMNDSTYESETVELPPGALLLLYTDGVIDIMNRRHDMFGLQRLMDYLGSSLGLSAEQFCRKLVELTVDFRDGAEPFDDVTLLAVKSLP